MIWSDLSDELMLAGQSSPFFNGVSGEITSRIVCSQCNMTEEVQDTFMSLSFKLLQSAHVTQIRQRFAEEGYREGLVTRKIESPNWKIMKFFSKKKEEPVLTIRDYLCYLNLIQTFNSVQYCRGCDRPTEHIINKMLQNAPEVLVIGFTKPESESTEDQLRFHVDLEFDISPFVSQAENQYDLICMVGNQTKHFGFESETIFMKNPTENWLKIDVYDHFD